MAEVIKGQEGLTASKIIVQDVADVIAKDVEQIASQEVTAVKAETEERAKAFLIEAEAELQSVKDEIASVVGKVEHVTYEEFEELRDAFLRLVERINLFNTNSPHKL